MNKPLTYLALPALFAIACAAPVNDTPSGDGDDTSTGTGGSVGVGTGGAIGVGTGGVSGTGGTGAGTGGTPVGGVGGTPVGGVGGTPVGGGTVTCAGTGIMGGYMDNGTMCGATWTAINAAPAEAATIEPPCGNTGDCFTGDTICGSATIPANAPPSYPGVMIGWNVAQSSDGKIISTYQASGTGIVVNYTATGATGPVRVNVKTAGGEFCQVATSGANLPWSGFTASCWTPGGAVLPASAAISEIMLTVSGADAGAQTISALCLGSVTNY